MLTAGDVLAKTLAKSQKVTFWSQKKNCNQQQLHHQPHNIVFSSSGKIMPFQIWKSFPFFGDLYNFCFLGVQKWFTGLEFLSRESLYFSCQFDCFVIFWFIMVHSSKICHGSRV